MGFRSYVRHFQGAILGLLRPSLPWCFPIRGPAAAAKASAAAGGKGSQKFKAAARGKSRQNHHFLWVSEVTLGIFGVQFWGFSILHCHGVFPIRGPAAAAAAAAEKASAAAGGKGSQNS